MEDLQHRDLSTVPDEAMSPVERRELRRRFVEFIGAMQRRKLGLKAPPEKKKQVVKWDPLIHGAKRAADA